MTYTPPGPQVPFDKDKEYGQEPGFFSRHSGKLLTTGIMLLIAGLVWFFAIVLPSRDGFNY